MSAYTHLLSEGRIGSLWIRNRIVMSAMGTDLAEDGGIAGSRIRAYYEARAKGGVGLIVTEAVPIAFPAGFSRPHAMALQNDAQRAATRELVQAVQRHGARIALQLNHHGPISKRDMVEGRELLVPSLPETEAGDLASVLLPHELAFQTQQRKLMPPLRHRVLTIADIEELQALYAAQAVRAREAGADGLEIHAAHGFLLSAFLSPRSNRRTDAYGGSRENRARFLTEVIAKVKSAVGADFPVWCKIDSAEFLTSSGTTLEDARVTARLAVAAGAQAIMASTSANPARAIALTESNIPHEPERMVPNAMAIKVAIDVPVIAGGRIEPADADRHIARGDLDFVAFGRKLLADPDLAEKLRTGRDRDVRPCIYCYACISQLSFDRPVKCAANPETGHEQTRLVRPTDRPLRIAVIGAGPAGMEASARFAIAGHHVTLFERDSVAGGTLRFAALAYAPNQKLLDWQIRRLATTGVRTRLATIATPEELRRLAPDLVVVATGAQRDAPPLHGRDLPHVLTAEDLKAMLAGARNGSGKIGPMVRALLTAARLAGLTRNNASIKRLSHVWMPIGRRVVIIGSELVGLELAEFLAERGRQVTVVDDAERPGAGLHVIRRARVLHELAQLKVEIISGCRAVAITPRAVTLTEAGGRSRDVVADTVIVAKGAQADNRLAEHLRDEGFNVAEIGDATGVGYIEGAMADAADLAAGIARSD